MQLESSDLSKGLALTNQRLDNPEIFLNFQGVKATAQRTDVLVTLGLLKIQKVRP